MTLPIWFLDIDGVVNSAGIVLPAHSSRTEATTAGSTWPIRHSPDVIEFINMVHRSGLAEIRWLTTWGPDARTSLAPAVGLDKFTAYEMFDSDGWWKAEIVAGSIFDEERSIIWTDDAIAEREIASIRDEEEVASLLISSDTERGFTSAELRPSGQFLTWHSYEAAVPCLG